MVRPEKHPSGALAPNDMPSTELGGNEIPEEGLETLGAERRRPSKSRGSKFSRR